MNDSIERERLTGTGDIHDTSAVPPQPEGRPAANFGSSASFVQDSSRAEHSTPAISSGGKYKVSKALGDTLHAIRGNAGAFILMVIFSYAVAAVSFIFVSYVIRTVLYGSSGLHSAAVVDRDVLPAMFFSLLLYGAWLVFAGALIVAITSLVLLGGIGGDAKNIAAILRIGFRRVGKVMYVNALILLMIVLPTMFVVLYPALFFVLLFDGVGGGGLLASVALVLGALAWIYFTLSRLALAPYIALFEPGAPVRKIWGRSRHIMQNSGRRLIPTILMLIIGAYLVFNMVTGQDVLGLEGGSYRIALGVLVVAVSVFVNSILVMLYHSRRFV